MTDALTRDARFMDARKTDQSGQRGWDFSPAIPRRSAGWWIGNVASAAACALFVAFVAALLWSVS